MMLIFALMIGFNVDTADARHDIYVGNFDGIGTIYFDEDSALIEDHRNLGNDMDEFFIITATYHGSEAGQMDIAFAVGRKGSCYGVRSYLIDNTGNTEGRRSVNRELQLQ